MNRLNRLGVMLSVAILLPLSSSISSPNTRFYNSLWSVGKADALLQTKGTFSFFFEEIRLLAQKYGLTKLIGLRLAHRHTSMKDGYILTDQFQMHEDKPSLVTAPTKKDQSTALPASWILGPDGYIPFEYSTDSKVREISMKIDACKDRFFEEFLVIAQKHRLQNLIVPAIVDRKAFDSFSQKGYLVERTYTKPFASIVSMELIKPEEGFITTWSFDPAMKYSRCICPHRNGVHIGNHIENW